MQTINLHKAGLTFSGLIGAWHALWAILVACGAVQPIIDFILWLHFIKPIYVISPFKIGTVLVLIAVTSVIGNVIGFILAGLWNLIQE